jgi:hypothetical protein
MRVPVVGEGERGKRVPVRFLSWAGSVGLGPGLAQVAEALFFPFFCSATFFYFLFSISFITFAKMLQSTQTTFRNFVKFKARF